jgi:hypothetical protein
VIIMNIKQELKEWKDIASIFFYDVFVSICLIIGITLLLGIFDTATTSGNIGQAVVIIVCTIVLVVTGSRKIMHAFEYLSSPKEKPVQQVET